MVFKQRRRMHAEYYINVDKDFAFYLRINCFYFQIQFHRSILVFVLTKHKKKQIRNILPANHKDE